MYDVQNACPRTAMVSVWGIRLSVYLFARDVRVATLRSSLRTLCLARSLWATVMALPVVVVNTLQAGRPFVNLVLDVFFLCKLGALPPDPRACGRPRRTQS